MALLVIASQTRDASVPSIYGRLTLLPIVSPQKAIIFINVIKLLFSKVDFMSAEYDPAQTNIYIPTSDFSRTSS